MKITYEGQRMVLDYSETGNTFVLYGDEDDNRGDIYDRLDHTGLIPGKREPNVAWVSEHYISLLTDLGVVEKTGLTDVSADGTTGYQVNVVHEEFNDGGYSPFGDYCRGRLGQQCQYGSRYITGKMDGYPALGTGLRFLNTDRGDYHSIRIHRDDMDEFERRYRAYQADRLAGR